MSEPDQFAPWRLHVDQHACDLARRHGHRLGRNLRIDVITSDKGVDHIEVARGDSVHHSDAARPQGHAGFRIMPAGKGGKAVLRILDSEFVEPERALVPVGKALPAIGESEWRACHGDSREAKLDVTETGL